MGVDPSMIDPVVWCKPRANRLACVRGASYMGSHSWSADRFRLYDAAKHLPNHALIQLDSDVHVQQVAHIWWTPRLQELWLRDEA